MIWLYLSLGVAADFDAEFVQYGRVLEASVVEGQVQYDEVAKQRAALDAALGEMASVSVNGWTEPQKLALYMNAYNACTLAIVVDARQKRTQGLASIRDLDGGKVWDTRTCTVAGESLTLNQIEHERVRPIGDARIHAALVCAAKGCPPLLSSPFRASELESQLTAASRAWVATTAVKPLQTSIGFSEIFQWYSEDFSDYTAADASALADEQQRALGFARAFAAGERAEKLSGEVQTGTWVPYDWSLNDH